MRFETDVQKDGSRAWQAERARQQLVWVDGGCVQPGPEGLMRVLWLKVLGELMLGALEWSAGRNRQAGGVVAVQTGFNDGTF